jgi:23S rRNA (pseudouridine1915-N3)-methyltransferase
MITVISVGKRHEDWVAAGIERYEKRLKAPFSITWELLPHSAFENDKARNEESERIRKRLPARSYVILLDERGKKENSKQFSRLLDAAFVSSRELYVIIGGAYGVDDELMHRADYLLSLSDMVFPHQLVRLMLTEQVYRAQEIAHGGKYHHE